jgi:hypothetical protein
MPRCSGRAVWSHRQTDVALGRRSRQSTSCSQPASSRARIRWRPLELLSCDPACERLERVVLGPWDGKMRPTHVVPAGHWQCARPLGAYALVGCSVGPGFDFADFKMVADEPSVADRLERLGLHCLER